MTELLDSRYVQKKDYSKLLDFVYDQNKLILALREKVVKLEEVKK